jgi:nitrogen regulatory protein PII 2
MSEELKEIVAIIRPGRWRTTQQAIFDAGGTGATQQRVLGRGSQAGLRYLSLIKLDGPVTVSYLPKRMVSCMVRASRVEKVVNAIIDANWTGNPGDGKIFVCSLEDAVRIRTGERGEICV